MSERTKPCADGCRHPICNELDRTTKAAAIVTQLRERALMNIRTAKVHPDPAARDRAEARSSAYRLAADLVEEVLGR